MVTLASLDMRIVWICALGAAQLLTSGCDESPAPPSAAPTASSGGDAQPPPSKAESFKPEHTHGIYEIISFQHSDDGCSKLPPSTHESRGERFFVVGPLKGEPKSTMLWSCKAEEKCRAKVANPGGASELGEELNRVEGRTLVFRGIEGMGAIEEGVCKSGWKSVELRLEGSELRMDKRKSHIDHPPMENDMCAASEVRKLGPTAPCAERTVVVGRRIAGL